MNEYSVKFKITLPGFMFSTTKEGVDVYKAPDAKRAMELCREDFKKEMSLNGVDDDEVSFQITEVKKI